MEVLSIYRSIYIPYT